MPRQKESRQRCRAGIELSVYTKHRNDICMEICRPCHSAPGCKAACPTPDQTTNTLWTPDASCWLPRKASRWLGAPRRSYTCTENTRAPIAHSRGPLESNLPNYRSGTTREKSTTREKLQERLRRPYLMGLRQNQLRNSHVDVVGGT